MYSAANCIIINNTGNRLFYYEHKNRVDIFMPNHFFFPNLAFSSFVNCFLFRNTIYNKTGNWKSHFFSQRNRIEVNNVITGRKILENRL